MEDNEQPEQRLYFPKTLEEAVEAIKAVNKWREENPEFKDAKGIIATHELFSDMFVRLLALEAMVKGGAAIKREKNVRKND